jgi:hypothetical protein
VKNLLGISGKKPTFDATSSPEGTGRRKNTMMRTRMPALIMPALIMPALIASGFMMSHVRFGVDTVAKSKVASVELFSETLKREPVDDSDNLSRASEVAYEFCVRR